MGCHRISEDLLMNFWGCDFIGFHVIFIFGRPKKGFNGS